MSRTIADMLREEGLKKGEIRGRRQALLLLLRDRFGEVPPKTLKRIETTEDIEQLEAWLRRVITAPTLAQMKIGPARRLR